jgi:hypothetical protein
MTPTTMKVARFLPLLALLALAPFALWSCEDAGDEPGSATGPSTVYNPGTDYSKATIVAEASDGNLQAGETFTVVVTYTDATGAVVTDAPLAIGSESDFFTTPTNPSYTNAQGRASFQVSIANDCPTGSYYFAVYTNFAEPLNGPSAIGSFVIQVGGGGISSVSLKAGASSVTYGLDAPFIATAVVTGDCTPVFYYQADGAGANTTTWTLTNAGSTNPNLFTVSTVSPGGAVGTMNVIVRAYCQGNSTAYAESGTTSITVAAATP